MSFTDIAIAKGAYTQNNYDAKNDGVNEYTKVTDSQTGATIFEEFDFDQNGAVDYRRGNIETESGVASYEEFYNNDSENNQKVWQQEPNTIDKVLRFFGVQTKTTLDDIDKTEMRSQANRLARDFEKQQNKKESLQEEFNALQEELEKVKAEIKAQLDEVNMDVSNELLEKYRKDIENKLEDKNSIENFKPEEIDISKPQYKGLG